MQPLLEPLTVWKSQVCEPVNSLSSLILVELCCVSLPVKSDKLNWGAKDPKQKEKVMRQAGGTQAPTTAGNFLNEEW